MGREWITKQLTAREATESVDALSKALYERLFDYLVSAINEGLSASASASAAASTAAAAAAAAASTPLPAGGAPAHGASPGGARREVERQQQGREGLPFFGVLDIFGFESFETNSLEQLAINFANEKLQQHFNATIFTAALHDYESEGIPVGHIDFPDNGLILRTIEGKPHGVLTLLKEECSLGSGTDESYLTKLRSHHTASSAFKISRRHTLTSQHLATWF